LPYAFFMCKSSQEILYTIGYEGLSIEAYINRLIEADIEALIDVRRNAKSRKYGFSKKALAGFTSDLKIEYFHMPELGIASIHRQKLYDQEDYDNLFEMYRFKWLSDQSVAINELLAIIRRPSKVALACYEANPMKCHRTHLANFLKGMFLEDYEIKHL